MTENVEVAHKDSTSLGDVNSAIEVRVTTDKGKAVFAVRDIRLSEKIGYWEGFVTKINSQHSLHLEDVVIEPTGKLAFLNHSCGPNSNFKYKDRWLYAERDILKGEEVTIDYMRTENEFTSAFECKCGVPNCKKVIGTMPSSQTRCWPKGM